MIEQTNTFGDLTFTSLVPSNKMEINNTKYSSAIRISHSATGYYGSYNVREQDWQEVPVPTAFNRKLHDVDVNAFTDISGFTHRNRVRHDVEDIELGYAVLNDADERVLLNLISPTWIYVELIDKKTGQKKVHKMYASDKEWNVYHMYQDSNGDWQEVNTDFSFSLVEE